MEKKCFSKNEKTVVMETQDNGSPCFYKIIFDGEVSAMRIPPQFLKHISKESSNKATLTVQSSGNSWTVKVSETDSGVYLHDGGLKFLRDNSVGDHEFLLFTYDGNMCFSVQIFNKSGCERVAASDSNIKTHQESAVGCSIGKRPRGRPRKKPAVDDALNLHPQLNNSGTVQDFACQKSKSMQKMKNLNCISQEWIQSSSKPNNKKNRMEDQN